MAFHILYNTDLRLAGVFGVSGRVSDNSGITADSPTPKRTIFGTEDRLR